MKSREVESGGYKSHTERKRTPSAGRRRKVGVGRHDLGGCIVAIHWFLLRCDLQCISTNSKMIYLLEIAACGDDHSV